MSEKLEQIKVRSWMIREWHLEEKMLIHVANEGTASARRGLDQKALGLKAGFPDVAIFISRMNYGALFIEMKGVGGGTVSKVQKEWITKLREEGYLAYVCKGAESAIDLIDKYLKEELTIVENLYYEL